jgi:hypothetical protein
VAVELVHYGFVAEELVTLVTLLFIGGF